MNQSAGKGAAKGIDVPKLWALHYRLLTAVISSVEPAVNGLGLEVKELLLLAEIDEFPHPAELAKRLLMPKPTVTVNVKRLEAAGFLKREIDAKDLRRHRLALTPTGRKALAKGLAAITEAFAARLGVLTAGEQVCWKDLLEKLVRSS